MQLYDAAKEVHEICGNGASVKLFKACLAHELRLRGIRYRIDQLVTVHYKGFKIEQAMQLDFVIEDIIPLNLTTKQENLNWEDMHTILRFSDFPLGISLNISETQLIDGFKKIQNPLIRKI
ncbi:MAG: GxxExxY protein [Bacteroidetes bacterium]|nr:GxxExxY protein [Bacteroidota bacterium]MBU2556835.1 GxxExxY protein [Bacteroidota bacterium]MDA3943311.1 GxxExxY protein [Bacteroidota bacterium]